MIVKFPSKKLGRKVTFDEVVHAWLSAEIYLPQYDKIRENISGKIIEKPDFDNSQENKIRLYLLKLVRGPMIDPLPPNIEWYEIEFTKDDLERTFIVPSADWLPITNNNYKLVEAIKNIDSNHEHASKIRSIRDSSDTNKNLVIVASSPESLFTFIEGNHRAVAFSSQALKSKSSETIFTNVFIGISPLMPVYVWHIESRLKFE